MGKQVTLTNNKNYVCPCDGYFKIYCVYDVGSYVNGYVNGERLMTLGTPSDRDNITNQQMSIFVKKGMTIKFDGVHTRANPNCGYFIPLE